MVILLSPLTKEGRMPLWDTLYPPPLGQPLPSCLSDVLGRLDQTCFLPVKCNFVVHFPV